MFDALDKLPANAGDLAGRQKVGYALLVASRVMKNFDAGRYRADPQEVPNNLRRWIAAESQLIVEQGTRYDLTLNRLLGRPEGPIIREFRGEFDKGAFGAADLLDLLVPRAGKDREQNAVKLRQDALVTAAFQEAKSRAVNAYSKVDEGNAAKVDKLIKIALKYCSSNEDAVNIVAKNIDTMLVSSVAELRSMEQVRERSKAIAANFDELKELSKGNPAIYEAGKRLMAGMGGRALPPGMIAKLVAEASNAKIDSIRKLSPRSSGVEISRAVSQFSDNLDQAMNASGAEEATDGPNEKQACRNFFATVMMSRCSANTLRTMQGAFTGEVPGKMLALYSDIADGHQNEGLDRMVAIKFENQAAKHMMNIANLKGAIDVALNGEFGEDIAPFKESFNADEFGGGEIFDDLVNRALR